jgi:hypothetical protein
MLSTFTALVYTRSEIGTLGDPPDPWVPPALGFLEGTDYTTYFGGYGVPGAEAAILVSTTGEGDTFYDLINGQAAYHTHVKLTWDGGSSWKRFEIIDGRNIGGGGPFGDHVTMFVHEVSSAGSAPFPAMFESVTLELETNVVAPPVGKLYFKPDTGDGVHIMLSAEPLDFGTEGPISDASNLYWVRLEWSTGSRQYDVGSQDSNETGLVRLYGLTLISETGTGPVEGEAISLVQLVPQGEQTPYVARDPRAYTTQPLVGNYQCEATDPWECFDSGPGDTLAPHCDETLANDPGYLVNLDLTRRAPPPVPSDPAAWPYFLYFAGETFPERAAVDFSRFDELKELVLRLAPSQQWLVMMIDPAIPDPLILHALRGTQATDDADAGLRLQSESGAASLHLTDPLIVYDVPGHLGIDATNVDLGWAFPYFQVALEDGVMKLAFAAIPVARPSITGTTTEEQVDSLVAALAALGLVMDDR